MIETNTNDTMMLMLGVAMVISVGVVTGQIQILDGDFFIEGVFTLYDGQGNEPCSRLIPRSVQHLEAVRYQLQRKQTASPKIGLRVHATCGNITRAQEIAYNISQMLGDPTSKSIAVIGPESNEETKVVSRLLSGLPDSLRPIQISFSADSNVFDNREIYRNFFRVIPTENATAKAIAKFMSDMFWTYVAIIHDNTSQSMSKVTNLQSVFDNDGRYICFPHVLSRPADTSIDIAEDLETILYGEKSTRGIVIIGDTNLIKTIMRGLEKIEVNITDYNYTRPVILAIENEPFSVPDITAAYNVSRGMYAVTPAVLPDTDFQNHWKNSLMKNFSANVFVTNLVEQESDHQTDNGESLNITHLSIYSPYAEIAAKVILASVTKVCQSCVDISKAELITTASILSQVPAVANLILTFEPNSPNVKLHAYTSDKFYDLQVLNNIRKSSTSAFGFEKIFEMSSNARESVLNTSLIRQYDRNGQEQKYPTLQRPQCPDGRKCAECRQIPPLEIDVTKGDLYIVGIVPVHAVSDDALTCGSVKQGGVDVAESIKAAVKEAMQSYPNKIPSASIGVIIIDSCNSRQIVAARLLQLLNQGIYEDGKFTEVRSKIIGYIGGWVSDNSIMVASILTPMKSVQISYGSTSPALSDRKLYPYFMRMIPNDLYQSSKMIQLVKSTGSDFIQILHSDTTYGRGGKDSLIEHAKNNGICVAQVVEVTQETNLDLEKIRAQLTRPELPKFVMVYLSSFDVVKVIELLKQLQGYTFIASEGWGNRDILANGANLVGSITLAHELPIPEYIKEHIENASKQKHKQQWLMEYMEDYFDCYYEWRFDKTTHKKQCSVDQYLEPQNCYRIRECYKIETWSPFAAIGVETLLKGAKDTLQQLCNGITNTICKAYQNNPLTLVDNIVIQQVAVNQVTLKHIYNATTHDGLIDLVTYRVTQDAQGVFYEEVKELPNDFPISACSSSSHESCNTCFAETSEKQEMNGGASDNKTYAIVMGVFIAITAVLVVALVATLCYYYRNRGHEETYLTPGDEDPGYLRPTEIFRQNIDVGDQSTGGSGDTSGISGCSLNRMTGSKSDITDGGFVAKPCTGNITGFTPNVSSNEQVMFHVESLTSNIGRDGTGSASELAVPMNDLSFGRIPPIPKLQKNNKYV